MADVGPQGSIIVGVKRMVGFWQQNLFRKRRNGLDASAASRNVAIKVESYFFSALSNMRNVANGFNGSFHQKPNLFLNKGLEYKCRYKQSTLRIFLLTIIRGGVFQKKVKITQKNFW